MNEPGTSRVRPKRIAYSLIAGFISIAPLAAHGQAFPSQMDDVKFILAIPGRQPPIAVTRVLLDGKAVPWDSPVQVSGDWMGRIVVEVENISARDMVFGELILTYPETGAGIPGSPIVSSISNVGRESATALRLKDGTSRPMPDWMRRHSEIRVPPGGTMRFEFGPDDTQADAYRLAGQIHTVNVKPRTFYFADGSKWSGGTFMNPAPPPTLWEEAPREQFFPEAASTPSE
jgi:hypothetical protein